MVILPNYGVKTGLAIFIYVRINSSCSASFAWYFVKLTYFATGSFRRLFFFKKKQNIFIGLSGRADVNFLFLIFLRKQKNKK
jgi:hypothetical protein